MKATEVFEHIRAFLFFSPLRNKEEEIPLSEIYLEVEGIEGDVADILNNLDYRNKTGRELKATVRSVARKYQGLTVKFTNSVMKVAITEFTRDDDAIDFRQWLETMTE